MTQQDFANLTFGSSGQELNLVADDFLFRRGDAPDSLYLAMLGFARFTLFTRALAAFWLLGLACLAHAAAPDFLVDGAWLEGKLKDPKTVVLEVRYYPHRHQTVGHIPGAIQVQRFKDLGDNHDPVLMRLPSQEAFQATLRQWGIDNESMIVLYDDARSVLASRLYFLLDYYGYDMRRVKVLDGGTVEWMAFNDLTKAPTTPRQPGKVALKPGKRAMLAEWGEVYDRVVARRDPNVALLDARPREMYAGKIIRHSVQAGHIPGAVNVVSLDGTDAQSQKWLSLEQVAALYKDVSKDSTVITYCHDGFRSTLAWLQLKALGYRDVRFFNGGWSQWDRSLTLPVVQGDQPFDTDFSL